MRADLPNVVLIVLDSVRRDHLSCYGYGRPTTPNIDGLAREGVLFARAYSTSCWTIPSHASLFTGLYPSQHRADFDTKWLESDRPTLAERLGRRGYDTACITANGYVSHNTNLDEGFGLTVDVGRLRGGPRGFWPRAVRSLHRRWRNWRAADRGTRRATELACRWLRERDTSRPFFLFMNFMDCHLPYWLRGPARYRFVQDEDRGRVDAVPQDPFACMAGALSLSPRDVADLERLYDGALCYMDAHVGRIDRALGDSGLRERTVFIVTSDHGESFGEHGLFDHQYGLYENLISVPLVVRGLPGVEPGTERSALFQHVDLHATLMDLAGAGSSHASHTTAGAYSALNGESREWVFAEYLVPTLRAIHRRFPRADVTHLDVALRCVHDGSHKLILRADGRAQLYDLKVDPAERNNLVDVSPGRVEELATELRGRLGDWPATAQAHRGDDGLGELRDRLEELGYL